MVAGLSTSTRYAFSVGSLCKMDPYSRIYIESSMCAVQQHLLVLQVRFWLLVGFVFVGCGVLVSFLLV